LDIGDNDWLDPDAKRIRPGARLEFPVHRGFTKQNQPEPDFRRNIAHFLSLSVRAMHPREENLND